MIGMMYLVLTAMLALNVSTDILNGFKLVDDSLHSSMEASVTRNEKLYRDFKEASDQNPEKMQEWYNDAIELKHRADSLYNYIQDFKTQIAILADGQKKVSEREQNTGDGTRNIEGNSNLDVTAQYAIVQGNGAILKDMVAMYRDYIVELANNDAELRNEFTRVFATDKGWNAHEQDSCDWEVAIFEGMPVGASITILTKMQNDVRTTESEMIQYLLDRTDAGDLRVNKLNAYVIPKSDYVIRGGKYSAQIILAAVDSTQRPEYYVEGQRINDQGLYEVVASSVGLRKFKGQIAYHNDGMRASYRASNHSFNLLARNGVKIEGNTVTQNGEPLFKIHRRHAARKTQGCYRELMPTLEYVKQEQKQEKPSIRDQLRTAAKQQPEKKSPVKSKTHDMEL
mgnify:CR=1 FL=1